MRAGERQVAPDVSGIRRDHVARYEWVARQLSGCRVIDFACGVGYGSKILAEAGNGVSALDIDPEAIAYAQEHYGDDRITYHCADASTFDFEADAAVAFEVIEHIEDPKPFLTAINAKVLYASVPNEAVFPWRNIAYHYRHYTRREFESLLLRCGWKPVEWYGQEGPESEVEPEIEGRTLIAKCEPAEIPENVVSIVPQAAPEHVAMLGLGPSCEQYIQIAKGMGRRGAFADEVWAINSLGDIIQCDRIFHMDDVRIQEIRAAARPESNIAEMVKWLKEHPGPIYTSRAHPDYPGLVEFPLQDVIDSTGFAYFNSTAAYAVAYAIHIGVKRISLFGFDFTYPNSNDAEKGRACVEFWLGIASAKGIKISVAKTSSLLDACMGLGDRIYGYDTLHVRLSQEEGGRTRVSFEERETLPTADEIEARYDHSRHPNELMNDGD